MISFQVLGINCSFWNWQPIAVCGIFASLRGMQASDGGRIIDHIARGAVCWQGERTGHWTRPSPARKGFWSWSRCGMGSGARVRESGC